MHRLSIVTLLACLTLGGSALAAPAKSGTDAIRAANEKLRELLGGKAPDAEKQIARELRDLLDVAVLAERALGDHWAKMTPKQRTELTTTLQAIIEKNYLSQLKGNLDYQLEYAGEEKRGEDVLVRTVIRTEKDGRPSKVSADYLLHPEGDRWRVFDIVTEEVSILQNYRGQFNKIIAKDGVDGLISRMKARLEKGEKADKAKAEAKPAQAK